MATDQFFYVLLCNDQSFYGGYTTDLSRRLLEHNTGTGAKYTHPQSRRPVKMIHAERFETRSEATKAKRKVLARASSKKRFVSDSQNVFLSFSVYSPFSISLAINWQ